jgi:diacylglycerol kinase family enzyme
MIWAILKQIRSGEVTQHEEFHKKEVMYLQTDKLIIHNHENAPLHIDGEPAATDKKFVIEILPKAFKLIMPNIV